MNIFIINSVRHTLVYVLKQLSRNPVLDDFSPDGMRESEELEDSVTAEILVTVGNGEADVLVPHSCWSRQFVAEGEVYPGVKVPTDLLGLEDGEVPGAEL